MKPGLLDEIKARGYWRINFQPLVAVQKLPSLAACKDLVEKNSVELRGWDYPHFPRRIDAESGIEPGDGFYQAWVNWEGMKEFWRIYQSGQFIHYRALLEDWMAEDSWFSGTAQKPGEALGIFSAVYEITEVFEFLRRLSKHGLYDEGVRLVLSLLNTSQRHLWLDDRGRAPLSGSYVTAAADIVYEKKYSPDELALGSQDAAFNTILFVFDRFGWDSPNKGAIREAQAKLLSRKFW